MCVQANPRRKSMALLASVYPYTYIRIYAYLRKKTFPLPRKDDIHTRGVFFSGCVKARFVLNIVVLVWVGRSGAVTRGVKQRSPMNSIITSRRSKMIVRRSRGKTGISHGSGASPPSSGNVFCDTCGESGRGAAAILPDNQQGVVNPG